MGSTESGKWGEITHREHSEIAGLAEEMQFEYPETELSTLYKMAYQRLTGEKTTERINQIAHRWAKGDAGSGDLRF